MTFTCPGCGWEGHPSFELNAKGKLVACCNGRDCNYQDPTLGPADFTVGLAVPKDNLRGSMSAAVLIEPTRALAPASADYHVHVQPSQVRTNAPPKRVPSPGAFSPPEPIDVISQIKTRRDWLEAEIAKRDGYLLEKRKLDKMLAAARRVEAQHEAQTAQLPLHPVQEPN